jgi:hypothetical protein
VSTPQKLFGQIGCNGCHTIDDVGGIVGSNLTVVGSRPSRDPARWPTTEAYVRASIEGPSREAGRGPEREREAADRASARPAA